MKFVKVILICMFMIACSSQENNGKDNISELLFIANEAYEEARLDDAERVYLRIIKKYPEYADGYFKLGNIYARQGQMKAAGRYYQKVISIDPNDGRAWYNLSIVKLNEAKQVLSQAKMKIPQDSEFHPVIDSLHHQLNSITRSSR